VHPDGCDHLLKKKKEKKEKKTEEQKKRETAGEGTRLEFSAIVVKIVHAPRRQRGISFEFVAS